MMDTEYQEYHDLKLYFSRGIMQIQYELYSLPSKKSQKVLFVVSSPTLTADVILPKKKNETRYNLRKLLSNKA